MCLILVFSFLGFEPQRSQIKFELLLEFYSGLPSSLNSHLWRDWYAVEESLALARIWRSRPRPARLIKYSCVCLCSFGSRFGPSFRSPPLGCARSHPVPQGRAMEPARAWLGWNEALPRFSSAWPREESCIARDRLQEMRRLPITVKSERCCIN